MLGGEMTLLGNARSGKLRFQLTRHDKYGKEWSLPGQESLARIVGIHETSVEANIAFKLLISLRWKSKWLSTGLWSMRNTTSDTLHMLNLGDKVLQYSFMVIWTCTHLNVVEALYEEVYILGMRSSSIYVAGSHTTLNCAQHSIFCGCKGKNLCVCMVEISNCNMMKAPLVKRNKMKAIMNYQVGVTLIMVLTRHHCQVLDLQIRDAKPERAVVKLIWRLKDAVFSKMIILSAVYWQSDVNIEKKEHDLKAKIQLKVIWYNLVLCSFWESCIASEFASGLVPNSSLALYLWRYKSNYFDKYSLGLHNPNFAGDFEAFPSHEWRQLYWGIGRRSCNKYLVVEARFFTGTTRHVFKQLQTSTPDCSTKQGVDEALNSMAMIHNLQRVRIILATTLHGFPAYTPYNKDCILLKRFWLGIFTTVASTLQVSTSHHSRTAGLMEEMNISTSHNGLMGNFFVKIFSDISKKECAKKVYYSLGFYQETLKSARLCGIFRVFDFVYTGLGVTLENISPFAQNHSFATKGYKQLKTNKEGVIFPRKELQVAVFLLVETEGLQLQLHVQVRCKEVNMKMHVHTSTGSGEKPLMLKGTRTMICSPIWKLLFGAANGVITSIYPAFSCEDTRPVHYWEMIPGSSSLIISEGGLDQVDCYSDVKGFSLLGALLSKLRKLYSCLLLCWRRSCNNCVPGSSSFHILEDKDDLKGWEFVMSWL